uniref:Reverse transcriptase domain-containing protein n=1 Tax=Plectus sambesii TaxID=2011161 RepID=A0A914X9I5_9BILA
MRKVFDTRQGMQYGEDQYINDLMYADDSAILAEDEDEATDLLHRVAAEAEPYGLKINAGKTKVMSSDGSPVNVQLHGAQIEQVHEFKYLGSIIEGQKVSSTSDIKSRIGAAAAAFGTLNWKKCKGVIYDGLDMYAACRITACRSSCFGKLGRNIGKSKEQLQRRYGQDKWKQTYKTDDSAYSRQKKQPWIEKRGRQSSRKSMVHQHRQWPTGSAGDHVQMHISG